MTTQVDLTEGLHNICIYIPPANIAYSTVPAEVPQTLGVSNLQLTDFVQVDENSCITNCEKSPTEIDPNIAGTDFSSDIQCFKNQHNIAKGDLLKVKFLKAKNAVNTKPVENYQLNVFLDSALVLGAVPAQIAATTVGAMSNVGVTIAANNDVPGAINVKYSFTLTTATYVN